MICLVICTEGDGSEPAVIKEFSITITGQTYPEPDIFTVPLGGNQGHKKLFEVADKKIADLRKPNSDSVLSLATDTDVIDRWIKMEFLNKNFAILRKKKDITL